MTDLFGKWNTTQELYFVPVARASFKLQQVHGAVLTHEGKSSQLYVAWSWASSLLIKFSEFFRTLFWADVIRHMKCTEVEIVPQIMRSIPGRNFIENKKKIDCYICWYSCIDNYEKHHTLFQFQWHKQIGVFMWLVPFLKLNDFSNCLEFSNNLHIKYRRYKCTMPEIRDTSYRTEKII